MLLVLSLSLVVTLLKRRGRAREERKSLGPGFPLANGPCALSSCAAAK